MTINATLKRLVLATPRPQAVAEFYQHAFGYQATAAGEEFRCEAGERSLLLRPGPANQLLEAHFAFPDPATLQAYHATLRRSGIGHRPDPARGAIEVVDPDQRKVRFMLAPAKAGADETEASALPPARLQHYALRTPEVESLMRFYVEGLGFVVSDLVHDEQGQLAAVFLRTDAEHHCLALFRSSTRQLDHFACETRDWHALRDWADHVASQSVVLVWGVGRHGPGNDTFFMVKDPDGNLAEISSDLEICSEDRPVSQWPHHMSTLNLWGVAIMRS